MSNQIRFDYRGYTLGGLTEKIWVNPVLKIQTLQKRRTVEEKIRKGPRTTSA
jgi:hypothetical protein